MNNLKQIIREKSINNDYDCLLSFSGGKDSSYLLYYLAEELKLNVVTVTLIHDFMPPETRNNIELFTHRYSKKHIFIENTYLNHSGHHFLNNWINRPDSGSLITFCTGCRLGLIKLVIECAKKEGINVVVTGETPLEESDVKLDLINYPPNRKGIPFLILGYLRLIIRNPSLMKSVHSIFYQLEEFLYFRNKDAIYKKTDLVLIKPFYDYFTYNELEIIKVLNKLDWKKASFSNGLHWRADCKMYAIRHYFYKHTCGYNEIEMYYTRLYKEKLISSDYLREKIDHHFNADDVIDLITGIGLKNKAITKYKKLIEQIRIKEDDNS